MTTFRYGSFNRPLDFISMCDFENPENPISIKHNQYPLDPGQPHSTLESPFPLHREDLYRFELTLLDVWGMGISDLRELCNPEPFSLPLTKDTVLRLKNEGELYIEIHGDDADIFDLFQVRDGDELIEIENADTDWTNSVPAGSTLRDIVTAARKIL